VVPRRVPASHASRRAVAPTEIRKATSAGMTSGVMQSTPTVTQPAIRTPSASAPTGAAARRNNRMKRNRRIGMIFAPAEEVDNAVLRRPRVWLPSEQRAVGGDAHAFLVQSFPDEELARRPRAP